MAPVAGAGYANLYGLDVTEQTRAQNELRVSQERLRRLSQPLEAVREEERARISREIHDELGQMLTAIKMDLVWMKKNSMDPNNAYRERLESALALTDGTIDTVKRVSADLRPSLLDDLGLAAALAWQIAEFRKRTGLVCTTSITDPGEQISEDIRTVLYRICQETITNVSRHAQATRLTVALKEENGYLVLEVSDNGIGISDLQLSDPEAFGILSMRERVRTMDGEITIRGVPGKGTTVVARVPVHPQGYGNETNTHRG